MKSRPNNMAIIPFNQDGLRIIDCVIGGYIPCLYMYEPVPHKTIEVLKTVRQKLAGLLLPGGFPIGKSVRLEPIEIQAVDIASDHWSSHSEHFTAARVVIMNRFS